MKRVDDALTALELLEAARRAAAATVVLNSTDLAKLRQGWRPVHSLDPARVKQLLVTYSSLLLMRARHMNLDQADGVGVSESTFTVLARVFESWTTERTIELRLAPPKQLGELYRASLDMGYDHPNDKPVDLRDPRIAAVAVLTGFLSSDKPRRTTSRQDPDPRLIGFRILVDALGGRAAADAVASAYLPDWPAINADLRIRAAMADLQLTLDDRAALLGLAPKQREPASA